MRAVESLYGASVFPILNEPAYWFETPMKLFREVRPPLTTLSLFEFVLTVPEVEDTSICVSS
jgi:hypothetical protein